VLGLTYQVLPDSRQGLAGPLVLGVAGAGNAFGPILGGFLTEALTWRWVLFLNLPIAALACAVTYAKVAADGGERDDGGLDHAGVATLSAGLVALLVALDQVTDWGWGDPRIVALLAFCAVALAAFVAIERRAGPRALIPPDVGGNRTFAMACVAIMLMAATFFALLLYAPQIMQKLMDFGALASGVGFLPMMATFSLMSFLAGPLYERYGGGPLIVAGAACMPVGMLAISLVQTGSPYVVIVPGLLIAGAGVGLFLPTITTVAVTALDPSRTSLAGGIVYMFQVAGGSVGLGLTTTVFTSAALSHVHGSAVADRLSDGQEHAVGQILAGNETSRSLLAGFPDLAGELERVASDAFVAGVHAALRVDAALALAGLAIAVALVARLRRSTPAPEPAASAGTGPTA
jgi:MFS family permease